MPRKRRLELIRKIEEKQNSSVICYITSDRKNLTTQIAGDAIRPFYSHLENIGAKERIDFFLYSMGGHLMPPFRLVHLIREYCKTLGILVPYCAHSGATMICLGANEIIMGKMGELSPVDPTTANPFNPQDPTNPKKRIPISVEDITSYINLAKEKGDLKERNQMLEVYRFLADKIHPVALGNIYRVYNVIRLLGEELLSLHMNPKEEKEKIDHIVNYLIERLFSHDFPISRRMAEKELGLNIKKPDTELESLMWSLYEIYEEDLKLREPFNPPALLGDKPRASFSHDTAYIESAKRTDTFLQEGTITKGQPPPGAPPGVAGISVNFTFQGWKEVKD